MFPPKNDPPTATPDAKEKQAPATGSLQLKLVVLKKPRKRIKSISVTFVKIKKVAFATAKDINHHIETKHPSYRFYCTHCPKNLKMANRCYKHQLKHQRKKYICGMCRKGFTFPKELKLHTKTHTGKNLYPCMHCPKNRTMGP